MRNSAWLVSRGIGRYQRAIPGFSEEAGEQRATYSLRHSPGCIRNCTRASLARITVSKSCLPIFRLALGSTLRVRCRASRIFLFPPARSDTFSCSRVFVCVDSPRYTPHVAQHEEQNVTILEWFCFSPRRIAFARKQRTANPLRE